MKNKLLLIGLVTAVLLLVFLPATVFAAEYTVPAGDDIETWFNAPAVAGDTLLLEAGTYTLPERFEIDKDITIKGAGQGKTTIVVGFNTGSSGDDRAAILVEAGNTLTISDLTMDGTGAYVFHPIRSHGTLDVDDVTIQNMSWNHKYLGWGIAMYAGNNTIDNVSMSNIQRVGIVAYNSGTNVTINNFTYKGKGWITALR